jgi:hypothetical protein
LEEHTISIFILVSYLVYSLTLMMEAIYSSEMLDDFHQTIQCRISDLCLLPASCCLFDVAFLLSVLFDPEGGSNIVACFPHAVTV